MSIKRYKVFETIDRYMKLYEADEENTDMEEAGNEDAPAPADATEPQNDENDPSVQAEPESGIFISDNQKAQFAKMMLDALMTTPPESGTIPPELLNVTTKNADQVIKYIQNLNMLSAATSLDGGSTENLDNLGGALKDI
jgi:hypothetical protein